MSGGQCGKDVPSDTTYGLGLGPTAGTLDAIQQTNGSNVDNCFQGMLKEWLRKSELVPTWNSLARSLRAPSVA